TSITCRQSSSRDRSAETNSVLQPRSASSAARRRPRSALRPQRTRPPTIPSAISSRATASPSPCVLPVTTATLLAGSGISSRCSHVPTRSPLQLAGEILVNQGSVIGGQVVPVRALGRFRIEVIRIELANPGEHLPVMVVEQVPVLLFAVPG